MSTILQCVVVTLSLLCGVAAAELSVPEAVLQAEAQRVATIAKITAPTTSIFAGAGGGSGVVISPDGFALTNFHVVRPAGNFMKCSLPDGKLYDAVVVGIDPVGDVALVKLFGRDDFPHAELGDSDALRVGQWCIVAGNPFLLATDFRPTITYGIVSGVHRYQYPSGTLLEYADCIQTDASINPGNSGGPLFNAQGQLVGINGRGSFEKRGRVNVGVGYAISINQIKHFLGCLKSGRIVDHATLGATVTSDEQGRVIVSDILPTSDAYRRGLRLDDEIVAFASRPIGTVNAMKNALGIYPKGWRVPLSFRRDGERHDVVVRLTGVHSREELIEKIQRAPRVPDPKPEPDPDKKPGEPDKKPRPIPIPMPHGPARKPPPPELAKWFEERPGFANYHFNRLNRDRVFSACRQRADLVGLTGAWTVTVEDADGNATEIVLDDGGVRGEFPTGPAELDVAKELNEQLAPAGSGGLLLALHLWRELLTLGPDKFGEVIYFGTLPAPGRDDPADVLACTYKTVEANALFDATSGELIALEMFPDADVDPCELRLTEYRDVDGRMLPGQVEVRHGDAVFARLTIRQIQLPAATEEAE